MILSIKMLKFIGIIVLAFFIVGICYGENNFDNDSDHDELTDFQEIHKYFTDPNSKDSDNDGIPDGDWNERREYTYTVKTIIKLVPLESDFDFQDDFQDMRVIERHPEYIELEVIHYPFNTCNVQILENPNWLKDYANMSEYLLPGPSTNWDLKMKKDLIAALKKNGIDIYKLTDKEVVQRVVPWLLARGKTNSKMFTTFYVYFPKGVPEIYPGLEKLFHSSKGDSSWTFNKEMEHEVLGREMFYNKTYGTCTSTAVYLTTALRAIGIPTRMILTMPIVDPSNPNEIGLLEHGISHNEVRQIISDRLSQFKHGWVNHTLNEVYIGNRWVRLNNSDLGENILSRSGFGMMTHILTFKDLSDAKLAQTWGINGPWLKSSRYFGKNNPYCGSLVSDLFGSHSKIEYSPTVLDRSIKKMKVLGTYWEGDPYIKGLKPEKRNSFFIEIHWDKDSFNHLAIDAFFAKAGFEFKLVKDEKPSITARIYQGGGPFYAQSGNVLYGFWATVSDELGKLESGVAYKLIPNKQDEECKWEIGAEIFLKRAK